MLRLSKKVEYALIALLHISCLKQDEVVTTRELSENYHIPQELLGKVLQRLAKAGFIRSIQGVKGGYHLEKPLDKVSMDQIILAVDGSLKIVNCAEHVKQCNCQQKDFCIIKDPMDIIQQKLETFFRTITLKDLKEEMERETSIV